MVPTGQIQPQNPFLSSSETPTMAMNMMRPEGWIGSTLPVITKYLKAMSAPIEDRRRLKAAGVQMAG